MNEKLKQIEQHIDWCIRVGILPYNYRDAEEYKDEYKEIVKRLLYDE